MDGLNLILYPRNVESDIAVQDKSIYPLNPRVPEVSIPDVGVATVEGALGAITSAAIASIGVTVCSADQEDTDPSLVKYNIFTYRKRIYIKEIRLLRLRLLLPLKLRLLLRRQLQKALLRLLLRRR